MKGNNQRVIEKFQIIRGNEDDFDGISRGILYGSRAIDVYQQRAKDPSLSKDWDVIMTVSFHNKWIADHYRSLSLLSSKQDEYLYRVYRWNEEIYDFCIVLDGKSALGLILSEGMKMDPNEINNKDFYVLGNGKRRNAKLGNESSRVGVISIQHMITIKVFHLYFFNKWSKHVNDLHLLVQKIMGDDVSDDDRESFLIKKRRDPIFEICLKEEKRRKFPADCELIDLDGKFLLKREDFERMSREEKWKILIEMASLSFGDLKNVDGVLGCLCTSQSLAIWISDFIVNNYPFLFKMEVPIDNQRREILSKGERDLSLPFIEESKLPFDGIGRDLNFSIFAGLDLNDFNRSMRVCKRWKSFFDQNALWKAFFSLRFSAPLVTPKTHSENWKRVFYDRCRFIDEEKIWAKNIRTSVSSLEINKFVENLTLQDVIQVWNRGVGSRATVDRFSLFKEEGSIPYHFFKYIYVIYQGEHQTKFVAYWDFDRGIPSMEPVSLLLSVNEYVPDPSCYYVDGWLLRMDKESKWILSFKVKGMFNPYHPSHINLDEEILGFPYGFWCGFLVLLARNREEIKAHLIR